MSGPGRWRSSKTPELTVDHLMASACLPTVFQAVEIDGVPHRDGGYMGNPALFPLYETMTADILLVQINPVERRQTVVLVGVALAGGRLERDTGRFVGLRQRHSRTSCRSSVPRTPIAS